MAPVAEPALDDTVTATDQRRGAARTREVRAPHLFVALDCDRPAAGIARHSLANIDRVVLGRGSRRSANRISDGTVRTLRIAVPDRRVSGQHACLVRDGDTWSLEDLGSRNGTRVNGHLLRSREPLCDSDLVEVGHTLLRYRRAVTCPIGALADAEVSTDPPASPLETIDPLLAAKSAELGRVARSLTPVLLLRETGSGKEVLARAIHRVSARRGDLVPVNCGALPAGLVEAQLFGHVRGAFSGAVGEGVGLVRSAHEGTLLLDEIGDLPLPAQATLLRVLQEREVLPVGGVRPTKVDLRIIAATHKPLDKLVTSNQFRQDLFARLSGFTFTIPPVRERKDDIGLLVAAFAATRPLRLTPAAGRALLGYEWPLNAREVHQVLDVALSLAGGDLAGGEVVDVTHLPPAVAACADPPRRVERQVEEDGALRQQLVEALGRHDGNVSAVAREFRKARMQVQRWLRRFGIDPEVFRRG